MLSFFRGFLRQRGSVLLLTGLLLPFVIGVTGLAVDVGNLYLTQSRLQNAADAAALAGAADIRDDLIAHRTTVQGVKANHSAADNVAGGYVDDNLGKDVASRGYDVPEASAAQLQYKVSLTEDVPLYFLRVFVADKTRSIGAASTAAIIGKGKAANSKHLFVFKDGMGEVNSINNPDNMNIKGQIPLPLTAISPTPTASPPAPRIIRPSRTPAISRRRAYSTARRTRISNTSSRSRPRMRTAL
ncbi:MAG: pilus assembly protein TadG-related protein [Selenomonas bovis]|nr:pilus assembly protein TadG-related protein [Selenomonas bovis]